MREPRLERLNGLSKAPETVSSRAGMNIYWVAKCCRRDGSGREEKESTSSRMSGAPRMMPTGPAGPDQGEADSSNNLMFAWGWGEIPCFTASLWGGREWQESEPPGTLVPWECSGLDPGCCHHQSPALSPASVSGPGTQTDTPSPCSSSVDL